MKRLIAILIACTSFIQVNAQSSSGGGLGKLFSNAISAGSRTDGYYHLTMPSTKYDESSIKSYCSSNGIVIKNFEYGTINKFGDVQEVVTGLTFFPTSKTQEYIFNQMSNKKASYNALKETVAFIYWDNTYQKETVMWSGNVTDGCASGEGVGFLYKGTRSYYFEGYFDHGFPQGEVTYKEFTFSGIPVGADFSKLKTTTSNTGKASEGMRFYTENGRYGFLRNDGTVAIRPSFKTVVQDFKDGKAIVSRNDTSEIIINTAGRVIGITARQKEAFAAAAREAEAKRIAEEKARKEREIEAERARQRRHEAILKYIANVEIGDQFMYRYSHSWRSEDTLFGFTIGYTDHHRSATVKAYIINKRADSICISIADVDKSSRYDSDYGFSVDIAGISARVGTVIWVSATWLENHWDDIYTSF
ncbi:MAG: hypothetical protein MJY72_05230 [Bacteroidales bacterium]|nr:hypothetical protein [Bacteroidales bacterium]